MKGNRLLESLDQRVGSKISVKRYSLADMISESYKIVYQCEDGSNIKKIAESHLADLKENPRDIDRLSRQIAIIKELIKMEESKQIRDEDLVDKEYHDEVEPKKSRVLRSECNESDTPRRPIKRRRHTQESCATKKESIKEVDDPELTDEELEELAKHLENIRKERKNAPKNDMKEAEDPEIISRRGIRCHLADSTGVTESNSYDETDESDQMLWDAISSILGDCGLLAENEMGYSENEEEAIEKLISLVKSGEVKKSGKVSESNSYRGLANFKKQSESKAFYKTFKKMHEALKEGRALTRQESIDLYKAANSALTQLSIELEHNPKFLTTFSESSTLLSVDVNSLRESLARGKAPSKKTMKSLAKFSEAILFEEEHPEYAGSFKVLDTIHVGPDYTVQICYIDDTYSEDHYGVQVVDNDGNPVEDNKEIDDLTYDELFSTEKEAREVANKLVPILSTKYSVNESEDEDITDETPEDDFVGDDEGDMQSEEADAFDQEYADARVELHKKLASDHAGDEDPEVQQKLAQDAEEVISLPGTTEEQAAQINGEESSEESGEEDSDEPEDPADDDEITDDELEELKKHLQEMRARKK